MPGFDFVFLKTADLVPEMLINDMEEHRGF